MARNIAAEKRTLQMYISGFILSIVLTLAAYLVVQTHLGSGNQVLSQPVVLTTILVFALAQLIVQLYFFLHLGEEKKPRYRLFTLLFAVGVVLIVVIGSIWIMSNLGYHTPSQVNSYLRSQGDL